jgi:hypothetical protein
MANLMPVVDRRLRVALSKIFSLSNLLKTKQTILLPQRHTTRDRPSFTATAIAPIFSTLFTNYMGWIYLLHFDRPISTNHTTQHYIGYSTDLDQRIRAHRNGKGSRLCQVARQRGIHFRVAEVWVGDRNLERALKCLKNAPQLCPYCQNKTMKPMKLIDYPEAIADLQRRLLNNDQQMRLVQATLDQHNAEIETKIAFDKTLTNDSQRKSKRLELMNDSIYQTTTLEARVFQDEKTRLQIELELLRNQLSVLKLEMRSRIVQQEAAIAA